MKLIDHFDTFMEEVVNLNDTRIDLLEGSIEALQKVLRASNWEPKIRTFAAQGSWAHKTIIRPVEGNAFDADLLVFVDPVAGWTAKQYISSLRRIFADHGTYRDKVHRYSHCVTIEYAGERKIDIAPVVVDRNGAGLSEVCNYNADAFERSEPSKYTGWLVERNRWADKNGLRKTTRLLKYLRDIKGNFTCPSVLFTTLLGERLRWDDAYNEVDFADLPTALKTIVGRLDDWLQVNETRPTVENPVLPTEVFSDLWDDTQYGNFRNKIRTYREWIDDAYAEPDRDESIGKWQRVFGDDFANGVVVEAAARVSDAAAALVENGAVTKGSGVVDLVSLFTRFGQRVLPPNFDRLPHKKRPKWKTLSQSPFRIRVAATRHSSRRGGVWLDSPASGTPLAKGQWLKFQALTDLGAPIGADYEIQWRVANTDREASLENQLRGGFEPPNDGACRWEHLAFRGVHSVEAFVIRRRDQMLVAQSNPYYVVIE